MLGGTPVSLGIIEGAADAVSSLLKLVAGRCSDRTGRRKPFVVAGYAIAGFARPLIALASTWQHVFAVRLTDRVGKGLRGAPRDAMLGALAPPGERGRVFGFHRAMDHTGAVVGPIAAAIFLWFFPGQYRTLFALTFIPGLIALGMVLLVPEVRVETVPSGQAAAAAADGVRPASVPPAPPAAFSGHPRDLHARQLHRRVPAAPAVRTPACATTYLPLAWAALHVVKAEPGDGGRRAVRSLRTRPR